MTVEFAERDLLERLNAARAEAHLPKVMPDEALAAVAREHSRDMQSHAFFGHVSPTKGTTEARLRAAHLVHEVSGENLVQAGSPREAHEGLMGSPGHRSLMLGADFTHVGIGVVIDRSAPAAVLFVTMEFAREESISVDDVPRRVLEATDMARLPHAMPRLLPDDALSEAARQGIAILVADPTAAGRAAEASMAFLTRGRGPRGAACIEVQPSASMMNLAPPAAAKDPRAERLGVAATRAADGPESFHVIVVVQAAPGQKLACD